MKEEQFFYCGCCGACWQEDETYIHDIWCPDCKETFLDGNIEHMDKVDFIKLGGIK